MKAYNKMNNGENLSWCRPYRCGNNYYVQNEGEIIQLMQDGKDLVIDKDTLHIVDNCNAWEEIGCAECPWRDGCEAMDVDVEDFSNDDLADVVLNASEWDEPECVEAIRELCKRAGIRLGQMCRDGEDCSEIFETLHYSVSEDFMDGTPDYSEEEEDYTDWLYHGAEQSDRMHLCYAIEQILGVSFGL